MLQCTQKPFLKEFFLFFFPLLSFFLLYIFFLLFVYIVAFVSQNVIVENVGIKRRFLKTLISFERECTYCQ